MSAWSTLRDASPGRWLGDYVRGRLQAETAPAGSTVHVLFMFADHWEPCGGALSDEDADARARDWAELYPRAAAAHRDADGRAPQHTFFYPYDEHRPAHLRAAAELAAAGYGEVEVHLHHRDDTSASLSRKLEDAVGLLRAEGCLGTGRNEKPAFGFVHGDWALDNSRCAGGKNFCGVDDELQVLRRAGCFADYTFPAYGCEAQPPWVNRILRVTDDPERPRSYDRGVEARVGGAPAGDLVLLSGPLVLHRGESGRPRLDDGQVTGVNVSRPDRVDAWVRAHVHVRGRPEWVFVKVHSHGCTNRNRRPLLEWALDRMWTDLEKRYNDGDRHRLHYVTAREAYNILRAAEDGHGGDPRQYRNYEIAPPPVSGRTSSSGPGLLLRRTAACDQGCLLPD